MYSLTAEPLPRPPLSAFTETSLKTISENPDLFKITCLIHVNVFESLLIDHPNPLFCQSVFTGLQEGFWPWPDKPENYPETHDNSCLIHFCKIGDSCSLLINNCYKYKFWNQKHSDDHRCKLKFSSQDNPIMFPSSIFQLSWLWWS